LIVGFAGHTQILALFDRRQIESTLAGEALIRILPAAFGDFGGYGRPLKR
jgi:hypothetical protein